MKESSMCSPGGVKLFCRLDEVAVPEVYSGKTDMDEVECEEDEAICFNCVAVPEVHARACRRISF